MLGIGAPSIDMVTALGMAVNETPEKIYVAFFRSTMRVFAGHACFSLISPKIPHESPQNHVKLPEKMCNLYSE